MLVPAETVPLALLFGIVLGYAIRTEKTRIVADENRRLRARLRRKPQRTGRHFAHLRPPARIPRQRPARPALETLPMLGEVAAFPDPRPPRPGRVVDHTRPDGTVSPLTSVAHVYDHYRRRVFVVAAARVDHHTDTTELAAVTA